MVHANYRKVAAERVQGFYRGEVTLAQLCSELGNYKDPDVKKLLDLVEHEPAVGGLFGVSESEHRQYMAHIHEIITRLLADSNNSNRRFETT
jgi:hypothetical protein